MLRDKSVPRAMAVCTSDGIRSGAGAAAGYHRRLLGMVGHELRNPLSVISMSTQLLRRGPSLSQPQEKALGRIEDAARRMKRLVADLLDSTLLDVTVTGPPERRRIITTHDSFGYFAAAYGVQFITPQGVSTETQPTAKDVAKIISQIKRQKIPAVFMENVSDPRLLKQIADETGAKIGGTLYSDALTDQTGPAPTYLDLIRHNLQSVFAALSS